MTYSLFGLTFSSELPIPGLAPRSAQGSPDLAVSFGAKPSWAANAGWSSATKWYESRYHDHNGDPVLRAFTLDEGALIWLRFSDGVEFLLDGQATRVWGSGSDRPSIDKTIARFLTAVMALTLRLRGVTTLHASAVCVDRRVVAFAGVEGAGKSTLAAAFVSQGYAGFSDDLVPVTLDGRTCMALPGPPWLRLRGDAAAILGGPVATTPLLPTIEDGYVDLDLRRPAFHFEPNATALAAIYLLEPLTDSSARARVEALSASDAVLRLGANTWVSRLMDAEMRSKELDALCRIVDLVPTRSARGPQGREGLRALCDCIREDLADLDVRSRAS